jgi:transposase
LAAEGLGVRAIAVRLGRNRATVRRYLHAAEAPERQSAPRPSMLTPYEPYLRGRWAEGCRNGAQLWRELRERGYPGSRKLVARWTQARRTEPAPTDPRGRGAGVAGGEPRAGAGRRPSARRLAWLLVRAPDRLTEAGRTQLGQLRDACPDAATAYPLLQELVRIVTDRLPGRLDAWLVAAAASGVPDLATFAAGLQRERAELLAALELPWSTGPVEGHITRLKLIKRQGYGRCGLETLKRRFLRAA